MRTVLVIVADSRGQVIPGAEVRVDDTPNSKTGTTDANGFCPLLVSEITQSHLWVTANGYRDYSQHLDLPTTNVQIRVGYPPDPDRQDVILPSLSRSRATISRIHVAGLGFYTEANEPWWMAFVSSFRLYERFLRGEDITPILQETVDVGANGLRVFGSFDFGSPNIQRLYPAEHPDYYGRLPEFYALLAERGLYVQFTAFADTQRSVPGRAAQADHWESICQNTFDSPNVLLERVNENNQHENRVDADLLPPDGICSSFGSNGAGNDPPGPYWDYADLHPERPVDPAKLRQSTTTLSFAIYGTGGTFRGTGRATVASEPIGFADVGQPGRRVADPAVAYLLGLGCRWGAGGTAHSDCGVASVLLSPPQRACVEAFIKGVRGA
jgi:hypothetical protein